MAKRADKKVSDLPRQKPRNDSYVVLLTISLLAMIGACVILFYDLKQYKTLTAQPGDLPALQQPGGGGGPAPGPAPAPMPPPAMP